MFLPQSCRRLPVGPSPKPSGKRREKKEAEERKRVASAGGDRVGLQLSLNLPALVGLQLSLNLTRPPAPPTASSFPGS